MFCLDSCCLITLGVVLFSFRKDEDVNARLNLNLLHGGLIVVYGP